MTGQRIEFAQLEEAIDWSTHTGGDDPPVIHPGQFKLEVDALVETELEVRVVDNPTPREEPRAAPARARGSTTSRLAEEISRNAAWYDQHGQHGAAKRAREIADKLR